MSHDTEEPMEYTDGQGPQLPTSHDKSAQNMDEVQVTLSFEWSQSVQQQKCRVELEKVLQTWANNTFQGDCTVLRVCEDGIAVISLKPAPALSELQKLSGQQLKGRDGKILSIMSVTSKQLDQKTHIPEDASMDPPLSSVSGSQHYQVLHGEQSSAVSPAGEETYYCRVPVSHFWYVNHIYKEDIKRIEKENGVNIMAEVDVTFQRDRKDGDQPKALSEFINLVQKCLGESDGSIIPLKGVDPEEWKGTLGIAERKENKLLLTVSSENMIVCGPRRGQDAIRKSITATTNSSVPVGESSWTYQDTSPNIGMSINDPLVNAGLTMEESYWKVMTTSFDEQVRRIKTKFGVDFEESKTSQGLIEVKARYKQSGGNVSLESHAVRALLQLYQKIATSPMSFAHFLGGPGFTGLPSEGASSGSVSNGKSGYNTGAPMGRGATAGDDKDKECPICLESFIKTTQLKCKHEFCEECLTRSIKSMGPTCPVCKDVFGVIKGDQPDGTMRWFKTSSSLPGFSDYGTIRINYHMSGGEQTDKHSNPGERYSGIDRTAYLPDNNEGREVLRLLKRAFDQKLIFTIGMSRMTGRDNQVTWNDIHHKTNIAGGPECYGYPDPGYLSRVKEELKAKGIE